MKKQFFIFIFIFLAAPLTFSQLPTYVGDRGFVSHYRELFDALNTPETLLAEKINFVRDLRDDSQFLTTSFSEPYENKIHMPTLCITPALEGLDEEDNEYEAIPVPQTSISDRIEFLNQLGNLCIDRWHLTGSDL